MYPGATVNQYVLPPVELRSSIIYPIAISDILLSLPVVLAEVFVLAAVSIYAIRSHQHRKLAAQLSRQRSIREFLQTTEREKISELLKTEDAKTILWRMLEDPRPAKVVQAEQLGVAVRNVVTGVPFVGLAITLKVVIAGSLLMFVAGIPFKLLLGVVG